MKSLRIIAVTALVLMTSSGSALADQQNKAQQGCLNKVIKSARKISGAVMKDAAQCIRKAKKGSLPMGVDGQACLSADLKNKVDKAGDKVAAAIASSCATAPDFGLTDDSTIRDGYITENLGLMFDAFEEDLDATLAASDAVDSQGKCSSTLPGAWRKLADAMHKEFERCMKSGLKSGTVMSAADMEACLDSITADAQSRILKAAGGVESLLTVKCPAGDLAGLFPGLPSICAVYGDGTDATGIATCSIDRLQCRTCRIVDTAYALDRDCDLYDDALANGSCPDCGNTVEDAGEGCDDGNQISGDGCTALCELEFCGDSVINNGMTEECDDGPANSDVTPNACRTDCTDPICGDGVADTGEECDDGNTNENDGCTNECTSCGNGIEGGDELCDDGNTANGDCCAADCTFEPMGGACTGPPDGVCTSPQCNGAGACAEAPDNEGGSCDDGDVCSSLSECDAGTCTATAYVVTGIACNWMVVGNPSITDENRLDVNNGSDSTGDYCGNFGRIGQNAIIDGDLVTTRGNASTDGIEFEAFVNVDGGDIVTNNARVRTLDSSDLPGLGIDTLAAGQFLAKTPAPTFYDTTGTDLRVDSCQDAQAYISTTPEGLLDAASSTQNLGATLTSIPTGETRTINAVNVGGLNVFDMTNITGGNDVDIVLDGGGNPNTVFILRIATSLNSDIGWNWILQNGLTANHLLIYSKGNTNSRCEIGETNTGGGTIFCPDGRAVIKLGSTWAGAVFGGGGSPIAVQIGDGVTLTHTRFSGF